MILRNARLDNAKSSMMQRKKPELYTHVYDLLYVRDGVACNVFTSDNWIKENCSYLVDGTKFIIVLIAFPEGENPFGPSEA